MDGFLILDKPKGVTSHDIVNKLRKIFGIKRIGHCGTLDPIATGVLVICIGKCTKASNYLVMDNKEYIAKIKFGIKTDTGDITGKVIDEKNVFINEIDIKNVINSFIGKQDQIPPKYSAIKVNGKKLYEYARKNEAVVIPKRQIQINSININSLDINKNEIVITVNCSKGTYIRTLCEDIGAKLGTYGTMFELKRTKSGKFDIDDAIKLEDINENTNFISLEDAFFDKDKIVINKKDMFCFLNGVKLDCKKSNDIYRIYNEEMDFIGLASCKDKKLKREIILKELENE